MLCQLPNLWLLRTNTVRQTIRQCHYKCINTCSFISAIPLPPSAPIVTDYSERHMDLQWNEPIDDGGANITAYHIEAKSRGIFCYHLHYLVDILITTPGNYFR